MCWNPSVLQRVLDWQSHRASGSVCPEVDSLSLVKTQLRIVSLGGSSTSKVCLCIAEGRETVFLAPNHCCAVASVPPRESLLHHTVYLHWQKDSPSQVRYGQRPDNRSSQHRRGSKQGSPVRGVWLGSLALPCSALEEAGQRSKTVLMQTGKVDNGPCLSWIQPFLTLTLSTSPFVFSVLMIK